MAFRSRERLFITFGLLVILFIIIAIINLPNSEDVNFRSLQVVRDIAKRRIAQSNDREILREKIEKANIPAPPLPPMNMSGEVGTNQRRRPIDLEMAKRRNFVKKMTKFAWDSYVQYAWGMNELRPISRTGHSASIFGNGETGATIVDALDTLYLMDLKDEFRQARNWVANSLDLAKSDGDMSVFEMNIRFVGGLLSAFALTNDTVFRDKAEQIADLLLPAFNTPTGIPYAVFNARTGRVNNWSWATGGCSILSEFGSLHLEFEYLSRITNRTVFYEKVARIREVLSSIEKPDGLYRNYLNPKTGKWGQKHISVGALGDSFYEYLLKSWLQSNKQDQQAKQLYDDAVSAIKKHLLHFSKQSNLAYFAEMKGTRVEHKMDHLACFIGGLFALESMNEDSLAGKNDALDLAKQIGNTCHESYIRSAIGIGPESFRFTSDIEAVAVSDREKYYIQRPEVIEAWFYLWRATHDEKYRDWCWDAAQAIQNYCRTDAGYSGIRDVYKENVDHDDVQQSFLFAETFKYLYLVFSDDDTLSLDKWVFNTEAHPLPIITSKST
ncbi:unnamed protein product [Anisakis simplex]|uniref:alpha-1,2-Mannosidase n=1 Tax=Anisakis simplex TaxID=6269 RepID=A0A0M3JYQ6_ANISI|nr:unnamed protein product [Anisakis simplex]